MMLQPTSGREGFDYVKDPIDIKRKSINQQDFNGTMTNTSNEVNEEQSPKIVQQTKDAIKKAKD